MTGDSTTTQAEVAVIGGGPAGYTAAIRAAQHGLDVTLIERDAYGGTCLNYGCIPSKALISATDVAHRAGTGETFGVHADPEIDLQQMVDWKDRIVRRLTGGVEKLCKGNGVTLKPGAARFEDESSIRIQTDTGKERLAFEHAIVATGSKPIELPSLPFDEENIIDSREALSLRDIPERLAIVGAGYIGMELAGVFAKLGTDVTVIEMLDTILPAYDGSLTRPVEQRADELGIAIELSTKVEGFDRTTSNTLRLHTDSEGNVETDLVLVAVGRTPVTDIGIEAIDLSTNENGTIPVDATQRTDNEDVFAIGDVAGEPMLAHVGMAEGIVASDVIAGEAVEFDHSAVPEVVFTDPEIARVGLTVSEAKARDIEVDTGEFPFRANGRALTLEQPEGMVRVIVDRQSGRLLGGAIVGPEASELIAELGVAIENDVPVEDLGRTIHTHPTLSEAIKEAAEHANGRAIHRLNR